MGQQPYRNSVCEFVLPHDLRNLPPQSPEGPLTGLLPIIGPRIGAIYCAPDKICAHTHIKLFIPCITPPSFPLFAHCARNFLGKIPETIKETQAHMFPAQWKTGNIVIKSGNLEYKAGIRRKLDVNWVAKSDRHRL